VSDKRIPRLLVVDDEPLIIRAMGRALRGKVEIVGATDGDMALEHVVRGEVDVIIAEASVLDKQGRSFVKRLETDYPEWLDRLILASGGRNLNTGFFLQDKHGCPFLYKPIDPEILIAVIERIHKG
jgi:response regulator RpfG family c-di-GMP phosphodiesterase